MNTRLASFVLCGLVVAGPAAPRSFADPPERAERMTQQAAADVVARVAAQVATIRELEFGATCP